MEEEPLPGQEPPALLLGVMNAWSLCRDRSSVAGAAPVLVAMQTPHLAVS